jgi:undecaprenyl diphosphate synthase
MSNFSFVIRNSSFEFRLMIDLDDKKIPQHIAIIMDGNGRWATRQALPRLEGHKRGVETADEIVTCAKDLGVKYLTLFAFSQENWNRPPDEVAGLMDLLCNFLVSKRPKLIANQVRLLTIGDVESLPSPVIRELSASVEATRRMEAMTLVLALSYGSRKEIVKAAEQLIRKRISTPEPTAPVSPEEFAGFLDTKGIPDPDLLIRTSGENRISNFLLWQMAYTELYFTETPWPDFKKQEFLQAIEEYQSRERRFGLTSDQIRDFD